MGEAANDQTGRVAAMKLSAPRVAYFPDSFHEVNGVAHTSRHFEAFARRRELPFFCVHASSGARTFAEEGPVSTLDLPRGFCSFALEKDLRFDPLFMRHLGSARAALKQFHPDLIHITGPSDVGLLGALLAHQLHLPLAASWHTNVHEYAARRAGWLLRPLPARQSAAAARKIEELAMAAAARFYAIARVLYAPNPELCAQLKQLTGRACYLMPRGVDAQLFSPVRRDRAPDDRTRILGFVGRLSVEKNIGLLIKIERELERRGVENFRFMIVGHGGDEAWLRERLQRAEFTGVLRGEPLARAYANMDLFIFPSHTDTFGNVVLEALASGVPAIVTPDGGPKSIVRERATGRVVDDDAFAATIAKLLADPAKMARMSQAARAYALTASWDSVFEGVYAGYEEIAFAGQQSAAAD
jgi:glycosyltransferase involved in cell wall biosynthesis